jgi:hypothetical protein
MDRRPETATILFAKVCQPTEQMDTGPNNVLGGIPAIALDYSPAWDAQLYEWTDDAINKRLPRTVS